ncbi:MAG: hypothetical protein ABL977_16935 [Candidatus Eisenbacteria bacterium]
MRRTRIPVVLRGSFLIAGALLALAGCSRRQESKTDAPLTFEKQPDTTGLSAGADVLVELVPYRMDNGAVRVRGRLRLPDSTMVRIAFKQPGGTVAVAMAQVFVIGGQFDTPPLLGDRGPLPKADYRIELLSHFDADWQPASVVRELGNGAALRGPGITRARNGDAALFLTRETHL